MIKAKNTKPEIMVRKYLFSKGFRYRVNVRDLPGKPDIVLPKYKTVIFVNGCFWHGHQGCLYFVIPKTRTDWWLDKIMKNVERDESEYNLLREKGWNIYVIWECQLRAKNKELTFDSLFSFLKSLV